MTKIALTSVLLAASVGVVGCGGDRAAHAASRDCFDAWNAATNSARQATVAHRFTVGRVSRWRAQAAEAGNVGGRPAFGCGYLFHTSTRYVSISGEWRGRTIRWGVPPTIRGPWSSRQQAAVKDNAIVRADGGIRER